MRACLLLCWACITAAKTSKSSAHFAGGFSLAPGKIKSLCIDHVKHSLPVPCLAACLEAATRLKHVSLHKQQHLASMQGREKIGLVLAFTDMGFDVVVSDVDTVWLQDPLPFLAQYPEADILVSSDSLVRAVPSIPCCLIQPVQPLILDLLSAHMLSRLRDHIGHGFKCHKILVKYNRRNTTLDHPIAGNLLASKCDLHACSGICVAIVQLQGAATCTAQLHHSCFLACLWHFPHVLILSEHLCVA